MKKSKKLSIGLITSFIGALALTACNETPTVTSSKTSIVDFIGYNGKEDKIEINIDEFYSKYGDSDTGTDLFYNSVLETLIRYQYEDLSKEDKTLKSYDSIVAEANDKVKAQKQTATDNAKSNGTKYDEEYAKILESFNVKNTKELKEYFLYQLEKEAINEWYFKKNKDTLMDQYLGVSSSWGDITAEESKNSEPVYPYHILHILVKLGADADDYNRATISASEAKNLWKVVRKLIDGSYTFEQVAYSDSEDSSNTAYGDVGIMSTQTSFYNEFKLGIYAYDALLSGVNKQGDAAVNSKIYKAFGIAEDATVVESVTNNGGVAKENKVLVVNEAKKQMITRVRNAMTGYDVDKDHPTPDAYESIPSIPYDVFRKIGEKADDEKIGTFEPEAGSVAYPRNVLFNQFLNFRSPFIISDEDVIDVYSDEVTAKTEEHNFETGDLKLEKTNFLTKEDTLKFVPNYDGDSRILADQNKNVIIGVRSTAGIHFMVMRKSVFKKTNDALGKTETLQQYYTTQDVTDENYPSETYVNMVNSDDSNYYTERINTIKNKLKGQDSSDTFDAAYEYRIYETLLARAQETKTIKFFDDDGKGSVVAENIANKIKLLRESKAASNEESINDAWESYLAQLRHQNDMRNYNGILKTTCVFKFAAGDTDAFKEGEECYVK